MIARIHDNVRSSHCTIIYYLIVTIMVALLSRFSYVHFTRINIVQIGNNNVIYIKMDGVSTGNNKFNLKIIIIIISILRKPLGNQIFVEINLFETLCILYYVLIRYVVYYTYAFGSLDRKKNNSTHSTI